MKTLLTIFTLVFTVMFSSTSFAEWTKVIKNKSGATLYVDFERIRKHDGYVYWWTLIDLLKPFNGMLSYKVYNQGDCKLFRHKILSNSIHEEPMGGGTGKTDNRSDKEWSYPSPNTVYETALKAVCSR